MSHPASRPRLRVLLLATGLALQLAACGSATVTPVPTAGPPSSSPGGSTGPGSSEPPGGSPVPTIAPPPGLLLEVTTEGGFINPAASLGALPQVVVDDDGRIYAPPPLLDPAVTPLVPSVEVRDTGSGGAARILAAIRAAGLDHEASGGIAADAGTTVFTVSINGDLIVSRFARGGGPGGPGGPAGPGASGASDAPGAAAFDLLARLLDPTVTWGAPSVPAAPYLPSGYRVFAAPGAPADAASGGTSVAWPLATALDAFGAPAVPDLGITGLRSGVIVGGDGATLGRALAGASSSTTFTSNGKPFTLWVRPLFPDELGG